MIEVRTLGLLEFRDTSGDQVRVVPLAPRQAALLAFLALARPRGRVTRERIVGVFWPEMEPTRARAALSQSLYRLRVELGRNIVENGGDTSIGLRWDEVSCDALRFDAALDDGRIEEALEACGGELLAGFYLGGTPSFEHWLDDERARCRDRAVSAAVRLAERLESEDNPAGAAHWLRKALGWSPYDERLAESLTRVLALAGDRAGAIREYERFAIRLSEDLELGPSERLSRHVAALRIAVPAEAPADKSVTPAPQVLRAVVSEAGDEASEPGPGAVVVVRADRPRRASRRKRMSWALLVPVLAAILLAGKRTLARVESSDARIEESVAILPFSIRGSDRFEFLSEGMVDLLGTGLSLPDRVQPVDPRAVLSYLHSRGSDDSDIDEGREVARRFRSARFVLGSIIDDGIRARLSASLYDQAGTPVATGTAEIEEESSVFDAVDQLAAGLLAGYELKADSAVNRIATRATTSLPALKAFLTGQRMLRLGRWAESVSAFQEAIARDTGFAMAYSRLSEAAGWSGDEIARWAGLEAYKRRDRLPLQMRLNAEFFYAYNITGDWQVAERYRKEAVRLLPGNVEAAYELGDLYFHGSGRVPASNIRRFFERALELQPDHVPALLHAARIAALERDYPALDSLTRKALRLDSSGENGVELRALRGVGLHEDAGLAATLREFRELDDAMLERMVFRVATYTQEFDRSRPLAELLREPGRSVYRQELGTIALALFDAAAGRFSKAWNALDRPEEIEVPALLAARALIATSPHMPVTDAQLASLSDPLASWRVRRRQLPPVSYASHLGELAYVSSIMYVLDGLVEALAGDPAAADAIADEAVLRHKGGYPFVARDIRAAADLAAGDPAAALAVLGRTFDKAGGEREVYLRAAALSALGEDREALRWYASFMHEVPFAFLSQAPIHLEMARILDRLGEREQAARHYARFIELWSDCDPELRPLVDEARNRLRQAS